MKVRVIKMYTDLEKGKAFSSGDVLDVTSDRYDADINISEWGIE